MMYLLLIGSISVIKEIGSLSFYQPLMDYPKEKTVSLS